MQLIIIILNKKQSYKASKKISTDKKKVIFKISVVIFRLLVINYDIDILYALKNSCQLHFHLTIYKRVILMKSLDEYKQEFAIITFTCALTIKICFQIL